MTEEWVRVSAWAVQETDGVDELDLDPGQVQGLEREMVVGRAQESGPGMVKEPVLD